MNNIAKFTLGMFLVAASVGATAKVDSIKLQNYAKHAQFINMKISPDGKHLAATTRTETGAIRLTILSVSNNEIVSITEGKESEAVADFGWADNERVIVSLAQEYGSYDAPMATGDLLSINVNGKNKTIIAGPRSEDSRIRIARIIDLLPEVDDELIISSFSPFSEEPYLELQRVKASSGRKKNMGKLPLRVYKGTNTSVLLDHNGIARLATGIAPDKNNQSIVVTRDNKDDEWHEVLRFDSDSGSFTPLTFLADNSTVVGISDNTTDTLSISSFDLKTNKQTVQVTHPDTDLLPIVSINNGKVNEVIGASYELDSIENVFLEDITDTGFANILASLSNSFKNQTVEITSSTLDNAKLVITVSSANNPKQFYLFDTKQRRLSVIIKSKPWLDKKDIPKTSLISYKTRDGINIRGLLTLPIDANKNLPLVMHPHGGPHGIRDSLSTLSSDAKVLASHGYAVFQPNYRGSGGYGKDFMQQGYQNWGTSMIDDMTDGVNFLIEQGVVDKDRVCSYGASYGGYAAIQSAIREPDLYKCAVGFVGVYDLQLMFEEGDISESSSGLNYLESVLPKTKELREAQSPVYNVDKLKAPVFIIQGGQDVRVPEEHAFRLRDALKKRNHPVEWMYKKGEGHGFYKPEHNVERWEKMLTFFEKNIGK
ncbi:S9 family peptidase [Pseudoalteromonas aliena]|uniref:alpha/beta hydrolase family protein n=1 Tax=Pseudoalteromonas aliena TaxID=247523 RepID=UPI00311F720E